MSLESISGPLFSQLLVGGLVGFLIGFAIKKMFKVALFLAGIFFVTIAYMEHTELIALNHEQFALLVNDLLRRAGANLALPNFLAINLPLLASFGGALAFGMKKG